MDDAPHDSELAAETDIIFECPHCGKSLAIDSRGAGLMIPCPDCGREVRVPDTAAGEEAAAEDAAPPEKTAPARTAPDPLASPQAKIERLVSNLEEIRERRRHLEQLRTENMARFDQIGREIEIIQNALDRIVALLQDAAAEKLGEKPPET